MRTLKMFVAGLILVLATTSPTTAGPYEDGNAAFLRQDYPLAITAYQQAARQGLALAKFRLGIIYAEGLVVPRDNVRAHMWLSLAASSFAGTSELNTRAGKSRNILANRMTAAQISESRVLARHAATLWQVAAR